MHRTDHPLPTVAIALSLRTRAHSSSAPPRPVYAEECSTAQIHIATGLYRPRCAPYTSNVVLFSRPLQVGTVATLSSSVPAAAAAATLTGGAADRWRRFVRKGKSRYVICALLRFAADSHIAAHSFAPLAVARVCHMLAPPRRGTSTRAPRHRCQHPPRSHMYAIGRALRGERRPRSTKARNNVTSLLATRRMRSSLVLSHTRRATWIKQEHVPRTSTAQEAGIARKKERRGR